MKIINNNKTNYKDLLNVICMIVLVILITFIYMLYTTLYTEVPESDILITILALLFYGLSAKAVIIAIKIHKQHIKEEMKRWIAPDKNKVIWWEIFNKIIIPEYDIPNQVPPVIVWFLYDMEIWKEDIVCFIYKWIWMWIISISYTKWWIIITKKWDIQKKDTPSYEYKFRDLLFKDWDTTQFPNDWVCNKLNIIKRWIEEYCIEKGWIYYKSIYSIFIDKGKLSKKSKFIPFWRILWIFLSIAMIILCIFIASKLQHMDINKTRVTICATCIGLAIPISEIFIFYFLISMKETSNKHTIKLTKQWEELVRKIHWYKKFLEACEEKQLKEFMKQDPLYIDKTLPYAVALGLENIISSKIPQKILDDKSRNIFLLEKVI